MWLYSILPLQMVSEKRDVLTLIICFFVFLFNQARLDVIVIYYGNHPTLKILTLCLKIWPPFCPFVYFCKDEFDWLLTSNFGIISFHCCAHAVMTFSHYSQYSQSLRLLQNTVLVSGQHCHFPSSTISGIKIFAIYNRLCKIWRDWIEWIKLSKCNQKNYVSFMTIFAENMILLACLIGIHFTVGGTLSLLFEM